MPVQQSPIAEYFATQQAINDMITGTQRVALPGQMHYGAHLLGLPTNPEARLFTSYVSNWHHGAPAQMFNLQ